MSGTGEISLLEEAERIGKYLIGESPTAREKDLYVKAQETLEIQLNADDTALLRSALSGPFMAGVIDGGLALTAPQSPVRKKLFVMLAILEASPDHCDRFLSEGFGPAGIAAMVLRGAWAGIKGMLGVLYLQFFYWKRAQVKPQPGAH